jgi:hypothetical protein
MLLSVVLVLLLSACGAFEIEVEVRNPSSAVRGSETVEISWDRLTALHSAIILDPDRVIVLDGRKQIPSQVVYAGSETPEMLLFQVSLPAGGSRVYTIRSGSPKKYPVQAYGRFVPERAGDYAWENDRIGFRVYGPELADPLTPGVDVWLKSTARLVIDDWYARGDYHTDKGEGMDAYKVGRSLGGGAAAPLIDGTLRLSGNYATQERLDNGPIRTTVRLTYAPFAAGTDTVALEKTISLDAGSHFSRMTEVYTGDFDTLPIAAGVVLHQVKDTITGPGILGILEAVSDSKQPEKDGLVALGVVLPGDPQIVRADGHLLAVTPVRNGIPLIYWGGAGWSKGGVADRAAWETLLRQKREEIENPLQVIVK